MIAVTVVTAVIATIAHLDGTTAVTVLITIPSMYPVYKKMKIDPRILLCLTGACMGVMNLLPWGGPTARAATVLEMDMQCKKIPMCLLVLHDRPETSAVLAILQ